MAKSYFFYDLETTGLKANKDRIMQFAGIRTDENFNQIGEEYNILIETPTDVLPSPNALMVTKITPQKTRDEGYSEADFAKLFTEEICKPNTTIIGYNNVRFDDEFIRALLFRNYYDPYEWSYKDGRSRWDLLDVVRMTRALRPEGINWPVNENGDIVNKLELLSKENNIKHNHAHDALSDVEALIGVAKLIKEKHAQLFDFLEKIRLKNEVNRIVNLGSPQPFVYSSGRYDKKFKNTTVAYPVKEADFGSTYVYNLRQDPDFWVNKTEDEIKEYLNIPYEERGEDWQAFPIKKMQPNRCPAIAPVGVLENNSGWEKIELSLNQISENVKKLQKNPKLIDKLLGVLENKDFPKEKYAESNLYDGFINSRSDKEISEVIRNASQDELKKLKPNFKDKRLEEIFPRYKVRNFPFIASAEEKLSYENYRSEKIKAEAPKFLKDLESVSKQKGTELTSEEEFILEELKLWFESVFPES